MYNNTLPKDPHLLLSFVNMKLRNNYESLEDFAHDFHLDPKDIINALTLHGYLYSEENKQFVKL